MLAAALVTLLVLVVVLQVVLPWLAARVVRGRLGDARIEQLSVSAFPAIKLLWGRADKVTLRLSSDGIQPAKVGGMLGEAAGVNTIDAQIKRLTVGPLSMHDVSFQKNGEHVTVGLTIEERDLQAALPAIRSVTPVSAGDDHLILRGTTDVLGVTATVNMVMAARGGRIVVAPTGVIGLLATITLFSDPHLYVDTVSGHAVPGGIVVTLRGSVS